MAPLCRRAALWYDIAVAGGRCPDCYRACYAAMAAGGPNHPSRQEAVQCAASRELAEGTEPVCEPRYGGVVPGLRVSYPG
jgi:hypothetical protein